MNYKKWMSTENIFKYLTRGYLWLTLLGLFSCTILFVLSTVGLNLHVNPVNTDIDLFLSNYEELGAIHFFPYYLGIVVDTLDIRIPFFQSQGIISGLYHEAHIVTFMTFPCLALFLYYTKKTYKKIVILSLFILVLLLAGSTTNIISVLGCIVVFFLYRFRRNFIKTIPFFILFAIIVVVLLSSIDLSIFQFVFDKMDSSSAGYSRTTIEFALTPRNLIGTSIYDESKVTSMGNIGSRDVGYIVFILNIFYLINILYTLFKLYRANAKIKMAYLIFASYFFFHSTKVAMVSYSLTMLTFVVFCISHLSKISDREFEI